MCSWVDCVYAFVVGAAVSALIQIFVRIYDLRERKR